MIEIDDLSLNEWYACLKPYQKVVIEQLVSKYGEEKAAEEWLTARGPIQTATFGGSQTNTAEAQNYLTNSFVDILIMKKNKRNF